MSAIRMHTHVRNKDANDPVKGVVKAFLYQPDPRYADNPKEVVIRVVTDEGESVWLPIDSLEAC